MLLVFEALPERPHTLAALGIKITGVLVRWGAPSPRGLGLGFRVYDLLDAVLGCSFSVWLGLGASGALSCTCACAWPKLGVPTEKELPDISKLGVTVCLGRRGLSLGWRELLFLPASKSTS